MADLSNSERSETADRIQSFIERIERLEEEKKALGEDVKEVFAEAKGLGLNSKALRLVIARRKMERAERDALDADVALYEDVFA